MRDSIRYALIAGAVATAAIGVTGAAMQSRPQPVVHQTNGPRPAPHAHGRGGQRFLAEYDLNHDGKVNRDEFGKATARRFSEATGNSKQMSEKQFQALRTRSLHSHAEQSFRRADWNADGKLTFDEFANPIRASFQRADKQSAGVIVCQHRSGEPGKDAPKPRGRRGGSRGAGAFCARDDLNHDGKVTRGELDQALHQQFAAAAKGNTLSKDQFAGMQHSRAEFTSGRAFQRLDDDHDGKLTLQEFSAAQQKTFARMDRNTDGVITPDELTSRRRHANPAGKRS